MIGYAYLDMDLNMIHKTQHYIDEIDPGFFSKNRTYVIKHWKFDTEDRSSMTRMLRSAADLGAKDNIIRLFFKSIDYDLNQLKKPNADKIQPD